MKPGHLIADVTFGSKHFRVEGEMGLHPDGMIAIQRAILAALEEHERQLAKLEPPTGAVSK